jgi:hypothetical protein
MKDVIEDRKEFSNSVNQVKFDIYKLITRTVNLRFIDQANSAFIRNRSIKSVAGFREVNGIY